MATNRSNPAFAEPVSSDDEEVIATPVPEEGSGLKRARVKGTWNMYWGHMIYNFEDGKTYNIPVGLYDHLKHYGNIYDTL